MFEIIDVAISDPKTFHFLLKANQLLIMVLEVYLKILLIVLVYTILFVFTKFKFIVDELFAEALRSLETCLLVNDILCGKLLSSLELPITFDERF